jgi:predicted RNase H-like nuclease (RuvC/YqgF family)
MIQKQQTMKETNEELKWSDDDIVQMRGAIQHLLEINEQLNANIIAMNAKLLNEEAKVKKLQQNIYFLSQTFTNNTYEA